MEQRNGGSEDQGEEEEGLRPRGVIAEKERREGLGECSRKKRGEGKGE